MHNSSGHLVKSCGVTCCNDGTCNIDVDHATLDGYINVTEYFYKANKTCTGTPDYTVALILHFSLRLGHPLNDADCGSTVFCSAGNVFDDESWITSYTLTLTKNGFSPTTYYLQSTDITIPIFTMQFQAIHNPPGHTGEWEFFYNFYNVFQDTAYTDINYLSYQAYLDSSFENATFVADDGCNGIASPVTSSYCHDATAFPIGNSGEIQSIKTETEIYATVNNNSACP